ncbi:MAG: trigger factor [bacterium]
MEVETIEHNECELTLKITVSKEELEQEFDKKYQKLTQTAKLQGFRKGKVPRQVLETRYGPAVEKEVVENLISNRYLQAIKEKNIRIISQAKIEEVNYIKKDEPFSFVVKVEVMPEIELTTYHGIPLTKKVTNITDKDVDNGLHRLQEKYAPIEVVEKPIGKKSIVIFDFESFKDNKPLSDGSHKDFLLELGKEIFPQKFEQQLFGLKKGKEKTFKIKLSKEYSDPNMAGQKVTFKVKINEVKERKLPVLDDEFAKDLGQFDTIKELKEAFKKDLIEAAELESTEKLKDELTTLLISQHSFPLPKVLVEREIDYLVVNLHNNLQSQGFELNDYLKKKNMTIEDCRDEFRPQAMERVKKYLILDAIAQKENIKIENEEYETVVKDNFRTQPQKIKEYLEDNQQKAILMEELRMQKTLNFLLEIADIKKCEEKRRK